MPPTERATAGTLLHRKLTEGGASYLARIKVGNIRADCHTPGLWRPNRPSHKCIIRLHHMGAHHHCPVLWRPSRPSHKEDFIQ